MTDDWPVKAYRNRAFIDRADARPLRILAEYLEPHARFEDLNISDTIVFFGSARILPRDEATRALEEARAGGGDVGAAERRLALSRYYEDARELARRLTRWSKGLEDTRRRFVVCTGGGPGIMEAANRGASEAKGINIGLNISLPEEQHGNPYITRELAFEFHYFFMRKFWFTYLAKALVIFPGGFGTMDEFFELMTLVQTRKLKKKMPIVVYGTGYWDDVLDFDAMVRHGVIDKGDLDLIQRVDSVDDAYRYITAEMTERFLDDPGGRL
ncbi:MAG: TIGR00730 family Rossman fold protein [Proteobacteria bacterium]|nr:TIGR00730 family Rossman fold protein [Pseudomonadota bacterium]